MASAEEIQAKLNERYRRFKADSASKVSAELAQRLSSPVLLHVTDAWLNSKHRVIAVGQETVGWNWEEGSYYPWPYQAISTFQDFLSDPQAVEALVFGYQQFEFCKHQRNETNSPFWQNYRRLRRSLEEDTEGSVLQVNLFRMSLDAGSVIDNSTADELKAIQLAQGGLLRDELEIVQPKVVLFFTGPRYDDALNNEFPGRLLTDFGHYPVNQAARVVHTALPSLSFRTYHPKALRLLKLEHLVDEIENVVTASS